MTRSFAFSLAPCGRCLVHVLLKKTVEVSHFLIPEHICDSANLCWWHYAQEGLRKGNTCFNLTLKHCLSVRVIRMTAEPNPRYSVRRPLVVDQYMLRPTIRRNVRKHIPGDLAASEGTPFSKALMAVECSCGWCCKRALGQVELSCALFLLQRLRFEPRRGVRAFTKRPGRAKAICLT